MEYPKYNFNHSLKSNEYLLNQSLEKMIKNADSISKEISSDEIMADVFRKRSEVFEKIIEQENFDIDAKLILNKILEKNKAMIITYQELKKVSLFKKTSDGETISTYRPGKELEFLSLCQEIKESIDDASEYMDILKIRYPKVYNLLLDYLDVTVFENRTN